MPRSGVVMARIIEYAVKLATGLIKAEDEDPGFSRVTLTAIRNVSSQLVTEKKGLPRCGLCGKGPFTKKGLYLHLLRIHLDDIRLMIEDETTRILNARKFELSREPK